MTDLLAGFPLPAQLAAGIVAVAVAVAVAAVTIGRRLRGTRWVPRALGGAGIAVASYGVVMFLRDPGMPWPLAIFGSVLIEGSILYFAQVAYQGVRAGEDTTVARRFVWLGVIASAVANVTHAPIGGVLGPLFYAAFPIFGAAVLEFDAAVLRHQQSGKIGRLGRAASFARLASAAVGRLWAYLASALGVDIDAQDTDVEREMRVRKAGNRMYALQRSQAAGSREWRLRHLERRAQRARADAGIPADVAAHRAVLAHMRMLSSTRAEASDAAPYVPWTPGLDVSYTPAEDDRGVRDVTSTDGRTSGVRGPGNPRTRTRTKPVRGGVRTPDVSDLIPLGQSVYAELHNDGVHLTRDRLAGELRSRGHSIGQARAAELWRELNNGHKPALD